MMTASIYELQDYFDSIRLDIAEAAERITEETMYLTLNLARVLAYKSEKIILSKKEGGEWALKNLPSEYYPLIGSALQESMEAEKVIYDKEYAVKYAEYMLSEIAKG
ncbi:DUF4111 domain-containing protein [Lachnoclostridium sp. Marseille-P6806]|uniref:DUF4111 domain-containing protein n=1 Tax=Lachnoclostridium sp. Marseille-P6806 TaxID=2364793 RepID=UPI001F5E4701|nr:DUF4111 domain-containing protein [Lachnoclostridium sp. Marseille-P6806]